MDCTDCTLDISSEDEDIVYLSTPPDENSLKKITTSIPFVYTTRLEDMRISIGVTGDTNFRDIMNKILQESKPEFKGFPQYSVRKINPTLYKELCRKLDGIRQTCRNASDKFSIVEGKNDIVTLESKIKSENTVSLKNYYMSLCKPCSVVLEDFRKCSYNYENKKSSSGNIITISSDDDNDVTENIPLISFEERSISVQSSSSSQTLYKDCTFIFEDNFSGMSYIYYVNEDADLKEYFTLPKRPCYRNLINNYGGASTRSVIKENCCWYEREHVLLRLSNCIKKSVLQFMKILHTCAVANCVCCCRIVNNKLILPSRKTFVKRELKTELTHDKEIEELDKEISQTILELNVKNKDCNKHALPITNSEFHIASSQVLYKELIKKVLNYKDIVNIRKKEKTSSFDINSGRSESKYICIASSGKALDRSEFYILDSNGKLSVSYRAGKSRFMTRIFHDLPSLKKQIVCCWFRRDLFISSMNLLPEVKKNLRIPHLCKYNECTCCCKPKHHTQIKLLDFVLPKCAKHMSLNKMTERNVKLRNFDTKRPLKKGTMKTQDLTKTRKFTPSTQNFIPNTENHVPSKQNLIPSNTDRLALSTHNIESNTPVSHLAATTQNLVPNEHYVTPSTSQNINSNFVFNPSINEKVAIPVSQEMQSMQNLKPVKRKGQSRSLKRSSAKSYQKIIKANTKKVVTPVAQELQNNNKFNGVNSKFHVEGIIKANNQISNNKTDDNETILQSILTEALKSVSDVQTEGLDSLVSSILERFRNVRLVVNADGKVAAALNTSINTLSNTELKVLGNILCHAQNQVDAMGIFKTPNTRTPTNIASTQICNTTTNTNIHNVLSNKMSSKNKAYIDSYQSYITARDFQTPVIQNVFTLKNTPNELDNMNILPKQEDIDDNPKQSSNLVDNNQGSSYTLPTNNIQVPSTTRFVPAATVLTQPILIVDSGSIQLPATSLLLPNAPSAVLTLTDNEINSMLFDINKSHKTPQNTGSISSDLCQKNSLLYSLLNKKALPLNNFNLEDTLCTKDIGTDPLEPACKRKKIVPSYSNEQNDTLKVPIITSVSSIRKVYGQQVTNEPPVEHNEVDDYSGSGFQIIQNTCNDPLSLNSELLISDDEELPDDKTEMDLLQTQNSVDDECILGV